MATPLHAKGGSIRSTSCRSGDVTPLRGKGGSGRSTSSMREELTPLRKTSTLILSTEGLANRDDDETMEADRPLLVRKSTSSRGSIPKAKNLSIIKPSAGVVQRAGKLRKNPTREIRRPKPKTADVVEVEAPVKPSHYGESKKYQKLLYMKNSYLSIRGEAGTYYLCQALNNIYSTTKSFIIQWLNLNPGTEDEYSLDHVDYVTPDTILAMVCLKRVGKGIYRLLPKDKAETVRLLKKSQDQDEGIVVSDEESEGEEEEEEEEQPPAKRKKEEGTKKKVKGTKEKKEEKPRAKKEKIPKEPKKRKTPKKAGEDLTLHPNPAISVLDKDPFFETKDKMPFISKYVYGKLAIRAVLMNDIKMLKKLKQDKGKIYSVDSARSVANQLTAFDYAIKNSNKALVKELMNAEKELQKQGYTKDNVMVNRLNTGSYNYRSLGVSRIRAIMASRGTREGTNALTKDLKDMQCDSRADEAATNMAIQLGADWDIVKLLMIKAKDIDDSNQDPMNELSSWDINSLIKRLHPAIINGHRKLAGQFIEWASQYPRSGFSKLHAEVLLGDGAELTRKIQPTSVTSQARDNYGVTPLHCAAINPHTTYIDTLLKVSPDLNFSDKAQRRPIHYAAICVGPGPLQLLLKKGASSLDADNEGQLPLHLACKAGRADNVEILLNKHDAGSAQADLIEERFGKGGIKRPTRSGHQPIHMAAENGHLDVVKVLLKHGADVNAQLSISKFRVAPLMLAAAQGHPRLVKYLAENGAIVKQKDRLGRTALIHAVMNGHTHIASYLLNIGENPNTADSSENSALHYASAYGWHCIVTLLLEAGASPNTQNLWKVTPVSIAWMKAHMGIVTTLLEDTQVNVNFQDDRGQTLVLMAASSTLVEGLYDQMKYLIEEKGADITVTDTEGGNAMHYIGCSDIKTTLLGKKEISDEYVKTSLRIAEILVKNGCPVNAADNDGDTPLNCAVSWGNIKLAKYLMDNGGTVCVDNKGESILHTMAKSSMNFDMGDMLQLLLKQRPAPGKSGDPLTMLKKLVNQPDHHGFTPLLYACQAYSNAQLSPSVEEKQNRDYQAKKREFMSLLIEKLGADVNITVGMLHFDGELPEKEEQRYGKFGKHSVVNFLMNAKELEMTSGGKFPALQKILSHKPNLNTVNLDGLSPLCLALKSSNEPLIDVLVEFGANVNLCERKKDDETVTPPLSIAVNCGLVKSVKLLLKKGADVAAKCKPGGNTALHNAVIYLKDHETRVELVKALLEAKVDINAVGKDKSTPLHLAINNNTGHINASNYVQELLIDHGADLFVKDCCGRLPIHYVFVKTNRSADLFVKDCYGKLPIHYVFVKTNRNTDKSRHDPIELCRLLATAMNFRKLDTEDLQGQNVLHRAAFRGAYLCCHYLLQKAPYLCVSTEDKTGTTPLGYAVYHGHDNCACMLIQQNSYAVTKDIVILTDKGSGSHNEDEDEDDDDDDDDDEDDEMDSDNSDDSYRRRHKKLKEKEDEKKEKPKPLWTWKPVRDTEKKGDKTILPLFKVAIDKELQGVCFTILELPEEVSGLSFTRAIEIALGLDKYYVALRLLSRVRDKSILKKTNKESQNLFHIMALHSSSTGSPELILKVADALLDSAVPLDVKDNYGCTPVFYASLNHNSTLTDFFYKQIKKLDARVRDKFDRTLIAASLYNFKMAMNKVDFVWAWFSKLYQRFATLDALFDFPVVHHMFGLQPTIPHYDYFTANRVCKVSPFILTIKYQTFTFAKWLLESKASPNFPDGNGVYPLMHAVMMNDVKLVKLLLDHKYDPDEEERQIRQEEEEKRRAKEAETNKHTQRKGIFTLKRKATVQSEDSDNEESDEEEEKKDDGPKCKVYRAVPKKSKVNLSAQDKCGWTALHYCAVPLQLGTFDNPEIVWVLAKAGANLNMKDKRGRTPLDLALEYRSGKVATMIQDLLKVDKSRQKRPPAPDCISDVDDGLVWKTPQPDVEKDAADLRKKLSADKMDVDKDKPKLVVDTRCDIHSTGELVMDPDLKRPYSALMTKVDVKRGTWGLYNFYKLQLVHQKGKNIYVLFTCWGRIGDTGQYQHTPSQTLEEGVKEFNKIFREKSGNKWQDIDSFEPKPKKYRLVELDEEHPGVRQDQIDIDLTSTVPSKLPPYLKDTMKQFTSVTNLQAAVSRAVDTDMMPFGRLKRETLMDAKILLHKIGHLLDAVEKQREDFEICDKLKYWENLDQIGRLSSQYYQLIPQKGYQFERIQPLDSTKTLIKQLDVVNNLLDYEVAAKIMLGAQYRKKEINPLDYVYRALNCKVRLMGEDDPMTQYILRYVRSSENLPRVEAVYRLSREEEDGRLQKCNLDNHKLLWHGSGAANYVGILHQGLLVAPPGAAISGGLFGKGVYTSDAFDKSENYCRNYDYKAQTKFMLLCEVALGKTKPCFDCVPNLSNAPKGFDSVQGCGSQVPVEEQDVTLSSGVTIPLGPLKYKSYDESPCVHRNEFIVYRANQVALRYLIQFR